MQRLHPGDPEFVGRYRLSGRLGEGGMGRVYLGRTPEGQQAAVKVIRDDLAGDTGFRHRFRREVAAAVSVAGIFTARVLDADPDADPPWLATQYVEGPSLRELVTRQGPLDLPSLQRLALGLAEALSAIHAAGLVHRDLKPANVLLAPDGAKVIDFGIAYSSGSAALTGTGEMIGTPEYMAPEQVAGHGAPGPASDVFAMGATLCFAATGRAPFGSGAAALYRILEAGPDMAGMPPSVADVARACLTKDPARRPTAPQLAAWLRSGTAPTHTLPAPVRRGRGRAALVAGVTAGVLLLGGATAVGVTAATGGFGSSSPTTGPTATPGTTPPATTTPVDTSGIDPNGPEARYVNRLCSGGDLLVAISASLAAPEDSTDPVVLRREYLATTERTIGTMDTALADFRVLRDDAPTPEVRTAFGSVVTEFESARASYVAGRAVVEASDPLTPEAYSEGVDHFTDGTRNLALASELTRGIRLPPSYTRANAVAPACQD